MCRSPNSAPIRRRTAIVTGTQGVAALASAAEALAESYDDVTILCPSALLPNDGMRPQATRISIVGIDGRPDEDGLWRRAIANAIDRIGPVDLWLDLASSRK